MGKKRAGDYFRVRGIVSRALRRAELGGFGWPRFGSGVEGVGLLNQVLIWRRIPGMNWRRERASRVRDEREEEGERKKARRRNPLA